MEKLTIYTKGNCGYCVMLKNLLKLKGVTFDEVDLDHDTEARSFIVSQGHRTVPQVYLNGSLFVEGGYQGMVDYFKEQQEEQ